MKNLGIIALLAGAVGCGAGYTVVRHDESVTFAPATWALPSTELAGNASEALPGASFDEGLLAGLEEEAGGFRFERGGAAEVHSLRVRVEAVRQEVDRAVADVDVQIAGASDREVGRLRMRVDGAGATAEARARAAGAEVGRRVMHYVHNHERHHH